MNKWRKRESKLVSLSIALNVLHFKMAVFTAHLHSVMSNSVPISVGITNTIDWSIRGWIPNHVSMVPSNYCAIVRVNNPLSAARYIRMLLIGSMQETYYVPSTHLPNPTPGVHFHGALAWSKCLSDDIHLQAIWQTLGPITMKWTGIVL